LKTVPGLLELLLQHGDVVLAQIYDRRVAQQVHIGGGAILHAARIARIFLLQDLTLAGHCVSPEWQAQIAVKGTDGSLDIDSGPLPGERLGHVLVPDADGGATLVEVGIARIGPRERGEKRFGRKRLRHPKRHTAERHHEEAHPLALGQTGNRPCGRCPGLLEHIFPKSFA
jgi:hypothetical protein